MFADALSLIGFFAVVALPVVSLAAPSRVRP